MQFSYTHKRLTSLNLDFFFQLNSGSFHSIIYYSYVYDFIKTVIFRFSTSQHYLLFILEVKFNY